jgi:hypothetical protein
MLWVGIKTDELLAGALPVKIQKSNTPRSFQLILDLYKFSETKERGKFMNQAVYL